MVEPPPRKKTYWREYGFAFCATFEMIAAGSCFGWTSPTLPQLLLTPNEESWIVSLMILGSLFSPFPAALLADRIGRKITLLLTAIPLTAGWVIIIFTTEVGWLYAARVIAGFGYGMVWTITPMYLGEISSKEIRGSIGMLTSGMAKIGILLTYSIGPFVSITEHASVLLVLPIIFVAVFSTGPESPYFLVLRKREDLARCSLQRLRGSKNVEDELAEICAMVTQEREPGSSFVQLLKTKGNARGLYILIALAFCQQLCGSQAVVAYAQQIFQDAEGILDPRISTILYGLVSVIAFVGASFFVDIVGRRMLLILSALGLIVMNLALGTYFFVKDSMRFHMDDLRWLPLFLILAYVVSFSIGLSTVTFIVIGEIFPTNLKAVASSTYMTLVGVLTFGVTKFYPLIAIYAGSYVPFWLFSAFTTIGLLMLFIFLPETKLISLAQVQHEMHDW